MGTLAVWLLSHAEAFASPAPQSDKETLITAQHMKSNQAAGIITAIGKVEISHEGYILHADKVTYNQKTDVMSAKGHVALLMPSGEVEFADEEEITGDMKQAFARNIGIIFPDNSRLAARSVQRYDGRYVVADKGMYTACNVCKDNPDKAPLWQLRAKQIVHDNVAHDLYYHDATIDFAGLPVIYTPYLSGPDPTVTRRQGLLTVTPGDTTNLGTFIKIPYYFDIAPNIDAVIAPTFSRKDTAQFAGQYRQRFRHGNLKLDGSFTHTDLISEVGDNKGKQWRGGLIGSFLYNINNIWRVGTDVAFVSDKSYFLRYQINSFDRLTNRAYVEGFKGRNYAALNTYYFQDLRPGAQPAQPFVLPEARFSALGEPGKTFGGRWSLDGNILATSRDNKNIAISQQGPNTRRFVINGGWERQFVSDTGLVSTLSGLARANTYWADNVVNTDGSGSRYNNVVYAQPFAQATIVTRYPIGRRGDGYQQLLDPIVAFTAAPAIKPDKHQPLEDSLDVEFDETNLFSPNRFTGNDLIEGGSRAVYGLRHSVTGDSGARVEMFVGQSYSFNNNPAFPGLSGLRDHASDYVGRIDFMPTDWLNLNYGGRFDHSSFASQRQDAVLSVGTPIFRPYARYISAYQTETTGIVDQVRQATFGFDSHFARYWGIHLDHTQAFDPQPGPRNSNLTVSYTDECFIFGITAQHTEVNRADINSGTSVVFHLYLKNIGGVHTDTAGSTNFASQFAEY